jgi:two-component system sensor histidine kinase HydH
MLTRSLLFRIAGPSLFVSLLFLSSCITAAVYLHHRQSASLRALDENLWSRRLAADLLRALEALPGDRSTVDDTLHRRVEELIGQARRFADHPEEGQIVDRLEEGFAHYLRIRQASSAGREDREARSVLETELIPACLALERFNSTQVDRSERLLHRTVAWMAWGLVGVGLVGALAGVLSGYAVARGLGRAVLRAEELAEVGQIAAGLAHELRNPLTSIKMLVQVDRERAEARGMPSDDLYAIEQEIRRMEGRLNAFMDFARPPRPERRLLDLIPVVEQTIALLGGRAAKQRVNLRFDRPEAPVLIEADGEQVRQLLVNLVLNALDVMPRGGALELKLHAPSDGQIELWVLDTGPGIPPRHLPRLYEPFFTSKDTGLGLGLVVSQRIARDHGGSLSAWNRPEGGACFVLRLPAPKARRSGAQHD